MRKVDGSAYGSLILERLALGAVYNIETRKAALGNNGGCRECAFE